MIDYSDQALETLEGMAALESPRPAGVRWISISGEPSLPVLDILRDQYGLDSLALEDVVTSGQRPKFSDFASNPFVILSVPRTDEGEPSFQQLSVYVAPGVVVSFIDEAGDLFAPLQARLSEPGGRMRKAGELYLLYSLIDLAVDLIFPALTAAGEGIESLEVEILEGASNAVLAQTHAVRNRLLVIRRIAWATRELISDLLRHLDSEAADLVRPFLQDSYEHTVSAVDLVETYREMATSLVELHLSMLNTRMNEVMRVLTVIATLFIPPTFLVGVYGMNFDRGAGPLSMPELGSPYGYVIVLAVIAATMVGMLLYFRRKGWF